jgi:hypothetical protein
MKSRQFSTNWSLRQPDIPSEPFWKTFKSNHIQPLTISLRSVIMALSLPLPHITDHKRSFTSVSLRELESGYDTQPA